MFFKKKIQADTHFYSDPGGREENEDSVSIVTGKYGLMAVVADGLGGHGGGKEQQPVNENRHEDILEPREKIQIYKENDEREKSANADAGKEEFQRKDKLDSLER